MQQQQQQQQKVTREQMAQGSGFNTMLDQLNNANVQIANQAVVIGGLNFDLIAAREEIEELKKQVVKLTPKESAEEKPGSATKPVKKNVEPKNA